ncbi:ThiF family adenylyltransferase [Microbispora corallina]|uniref:ThiF family adenylyltransferase n=1 Tax=Microbispora corallina TaxID=83302 RepID=UPI001EF2E3DE|nr:ThiF family adenylyltransferase [Microbispora corallina]
MKAEHLPHRYGHDRIRIGGSIYGVAGEITDPDGYAWAALGAMDGTRTPGEIAGRLRRLFPRLTDEDAQGVVDLLLTSGYIEDAGVREPEELSPDEQDRYSRNAAFFRRTDLTPRPSSWEAQIRLKRSRVVVLGLGGTGSHTAWALAACGVGEIHCVDRDVVELSNLTRQALYREADIGRPKVEVAVARLAEVNSSVRITGESRAVESEGDMADLVSGFDAFAMCADEPGGTGGIRVWANRACLAAKVPWALGGYSGPLVSVAAFDPDGPCYECLTANVDASLAPGIPVDLGGPGVIAPSAGVSGHLTAQAVISFLTGIPERPGSYVTGVNLIAPDQHVYTRHPAVPGCPACGALSSEPAAGPSPAESTAAAPATT